MRVRILNLLRHRHELFAAEMADLLGLHRNDLNWHIKLLERAHLITTRRVGVQRQYRFQGGLTPFYERLIDFLVSVDGLTEQTDADT